MANKVIASADVFSAVTLTLDTVQYASGDVLAATQEVTGIFEGGRPVMLASLALLDKDDQAQALDIYLIRSNVSIGTENAAAAITDAVADEFLTLIPVLAADYTDMGSSQFVTKNMGDAGMGAMMYPSAGGASVYVAAESGGTGLYTAAGITLKLGFLSP